MKSSKRGMRTLSLVTPQQSLSSEKSGQDVKTIEYGWKPEYARMQASFDPYETWLLTQAKSYLGRDVTAEETKELFSRIDPSTRKPRENSPPPRPVGLLAALRALLGGGIVLLASGCSNQSTDSWQSKKVASIYNDNSITGTIRKVYDNEEGVVCYIYPGVGINCMVAKPGDGQ